MAPWPSKENFAKSTGNSLEVNRKRVESRRNHVGLMLRPTGDWPVLSENQAANFSVWHFWFPRTFWPRRSPASPKGMVRDPRKRSKAQESSRFAFLRFVPNIGKRRILPSDRQTPALRL